VAKDIPWMSERYAELTSLNLQWEPPTLESASEAECIVDGQRMIFSVNSYDRFVFLLADEAPMSCPPGLPGDHFGVQVDSLDELNIVLARAEAFRAGDDRVEILPYAVEDHTVLKLHAFYVRYLLPMSIEVTVSWCFAPSQPVWLYQGDTVTDSFQNCPSGPFFL